MNDRELLEMAAKAAGFVEIDFLAQDHWANVYDADGRQSAWNALTDDGDALRLAVKLGMAVSVCLGMPSENFTAILGSGFDSEKHKEDPYAATRRAIVRAEAEVGQELP